MEDTYCKTCGSYNTLLQTSDNHCCSECGDTEGLVWEDHPDFPDEEKAITEIVTEKRQQNG